MQPGARGVRLSDGLGRIRPTQYSEPIVTDTLPVPWKVVKGIQPIKVIDRHIGNRTWLSQAQIHGNTAAAVLTDSLRSPIRNAPTLRTEVKFNGVPANVCIGWSGYADALVLVVINPQDPVPSADRAIARGRAFRQSFELPGDSSTVTGADEHDCLREEQ